MSNIIKRRHTNQYAQIHNNPLQNDLVDLRAIGLLSHLMSLPSDWVIYKTQLYKKFSRKNIDAAWKELANKNYIIGFNCYIDGKKKSFYNVSDIPFVSEELSEFILETCSELINSGASVKSLNLMSGGTLVITEKSTAVLMVHQLISPKKISDVPLVQHSQYSTNGTYTKEKYTKERKTNIDDEDISNFLFSSKNSIQNSKINHTKHAPTADKICLSDKQISIITNKVRDLFKDKIQKRSFDSILKKCVNNYKKGNVPNYENYLITSIENKITDLELRREREKQLLDLVPKSNNQRTKRRELVPEWLHAEETEQPSKQNSAKVIEAERQKLFEELQKYKRKN
ncbi:Uncharacterized protein BC141101_05839 [Bacillus toyonensis]|uniref:hypothetical protein n=1 Tax=Bacillus cereus group TaxID=86661 RepID=UPI00027BE9FB|nr:MULTISPECIES: hypothetical protein [Bacillus cereus group]EJV41836.1 hypothetical protein IEA_05598 [Bacillus toyonensis]EJV42200.1 hypothetical protein IEK_05751 [Bacillus toyonensis]EJV89734.1 hypothetical protein IGI_05614 [Bacillus toyonensis]EOP47121.1 hypothetical protein IKI_05679 [Bacillus toyonensis]MBE7140371.1 hypothetical protein [Bacillus toyonensis]